MKLEIFKNDDKLTPVDQHIVDRISENPNDFLKMNVTEYSESIAVSASAMSRLSRKLEFASYSAMKMYILQKVFEVGNKQVIKNKKSVDRHDIFSIYEDSIQKVRGIDKKIIEKICNDIVTTDLVVTYGGGTSAIPARHLSDVLSDMEIQSYNSTDFHMLLKTLTNNKKKMLIVFTKSGVSPEMNFLMKSCRKQGINIWIVIGNKNKVRDALANTIAFNADFHSEKRFSISSKISMLLIVDCILSDLWKRESTPKNPGDLLDAWKNL